MRRPVRYINQRPQRVLHCYGPQQRAIHAILGGVFPMSPRVLRPVDTAEQLRGLEDVDFVIVVGHPNAVPPEINYQLLVTGAVMWILDDSRRRARYNRE